jgi:RNA polymerase sigma-70 factor, ECF subfamily
LTVAYDPDRLAADRPPGLRAGAAAGRDADAQLLARAAGGDSGAMAQLYRRHGDAVYRLAWLLTGSESAAADVLQATFLALLEKPVGYDPARGTVAQWLCGIARHLAWREFDARTSASEDVTALAEGPNRIDAPVLPPLPADELERSRAIERLHAALQKLPPYFREAIVLVELQQMSYAEAAQLAGVEIGTVRSRLARGKARLAELLAGSIAIASESSDK